MKKGKKKLRKKLEKAWVAYLIDATAGTQLMMISMRYPDRAEKLNQILVKGINDLFQKGRKEILKDPDIFVPQAQTIIRTLVQSFIEKNLTMHLIDGMPEERRIIPGGPGIGRGMPPMGRA